MGAGTKEGSHGVRGRSGTHGGLLEGAGLRPDSPQGNGDWKMGMCPTYAAST